MKYFLNKKWGLFIVVLIFCLVLFIYFNKDVYFQITPVSKVTDEIKINYPLRLRIPKIEVDAEIEYVGLTTTGEMDVPKNPANVAWFSLGSLPGKEGSAVIAGHFDDKNGQEAVFYNLKELSKGDKLFTHDIQGGVTTFVVREVRVYDSEALAPEVFISTDGRHLNLITCTGNWSESKDRYMERLIVFTDVLATN